jgi:hypothetical protein
MGAHGREPLCGVEDLPGFAVYRRIDDGSFISEILHPFLGKGYPDLDAVPAEDIESGMSPR